MSITKAFLRTWLAGFILALIVYPLSILPVHGTSALDPALQDETAEPTLDPVQAAMATINAATGTPTSENTPTPTATLSPLEAAQATINAATGTPMPDESATAEVVATDGNAAAPTDCTPPESPLLANNCLAKPFPDDLPNWRLYLGIVLAIEYVLALGLAIKMHVKNAFWRYAWGVIGLLLMFTKLGEWLYQIVAGVMDWGLGGKIIVFLFGLFSGLVGYGNISAYVLGAFIYNDVQLLWLCVVPSAVVGFFVIVYGYLRD